MKRVRAVALAGTVLVATSSAAIAQESAPAVRTVRGQLGASINNAGLQSTVEVTWRRPRARVAAGVIHSLTPAQTRLGGWLSYSPHQMFELRAGVDPSAYFGTFNSLQGFESYKDAFDKQARDERAGAKPGLSVRSYIAPTVRMKAGAFVASSTVEVERWRSNAGSPFFYEPTRDTLLASDGDRAINASSVVMYQRGTVSAGAIHSWMKVAGAEQNRVQKLGGIAVREFPGRQFRLPNPRVTMIVARYLDDPSKEGQWTAAIALGFRPGR